MQTQQVVTSSRNIQLVSELLALNPPASIHSLVYTARHLWADGDDVVKPIIDALVTRKDVDIASLRWLLRERPYKPYALNIANAIFRHPACSHDDLSFLFCEIRITQLLEELAIRIIEHERSTLSTLCSVSITEKLNPETRALADKRIETMRSSRDYQITRLITGQF